MRRTIGKVAGIGTLALLLGGSAFAAPEQLQGRQDRQQQTQQQVYRQQDRQQVNRQTADRSSQRDGRLEAGAVTRPIRHEQQVVSGIVQRIDARAGTLRLREEGTRRVITVATRNLERGRRMRRGDRVTISGDWMRGSIFDAHRIESRH
ncbi:MAG TPA: hypothetical protein VKH35_07810 [Thermoanaerobaculia bacterium]|nr:hypothetical protein [Thermoanaerobaculia bacterium]